LLNGAFFGFMNVLLRFFKHTHISIEGNLNVL
jgi:hypothetical protein